MRKFEIEYLDTGMKQVKVMISNELWNQSKQMSESDQKKWLKEITEGNEWFTDKSPIHDAIYSGELHHYGGITKVKITEL